MAGHLRPIAIALAGAALILSACTATPTPPPASGDPGGSSSAPPAPLEPTTLGFFTDKAAWEPSFDTMNGVSGDLTLDFTGYSDPTAYDAFIKQSFQTRKVPDLFTWHTGDRLKQLVEQGLVAETTELWTEAAAAGYVPDGLIDNFTYEGKQYCVPLLAAYWVMYYNKKVFAEHDLTVPTSWDELMATSQKLVDAGVTPFHQMNFIFEFVWFQQILLGIDPAVYRGLGTGESSFLDPAVVQTMDVWKDMGQKGFFIDPGVQTDPQTLLSTGQVAMANFGTFFTGQLTSIDAVSGEDYGIFLIPTVSPSVTQKQVVMETGPMCVGAGAANEQAALEYSRWWFTNEAQNAWSQARGDISFNPNVSIQDPELAALVAAVNTPDVQVQPRYLEMIPNSVYTTSAEVLGDFVTNWGDPMDALTKLQASADEHWSGQ